MDFSRLLMSTREDYGTVALRCSCFLTSDTPTRRNLKLCWSSDKLAQQIQKQLGTVGGPTELTVQAGASQTSQPLATAPPPF